MNFISLIAFAFALNLFAFAFTRIRFFVHRELLFGYVGHPESDIVPRVWRCGLLLDLVEISKGRYNFPRTGRYDHSHHLFHFGREKPALLASNDTTSNAMPGNKARPRKKKSERRDTSAGEIDTQEISEFQEAFDLNG